ncbi:endolytic transglycosylase MltG [Cytobacillus massiliigabonensis]|uniref:endolytic transglycosylase MltG n=1 Tax=Cytobacillus massiliigabonensis TaxID=1871011 RepID=UPI000C81AB71|nr:endolytic transglycosylase MltG [Cytobacillus massiliigabonensis]
MNRRNTRAFALGVLFSVCIFGIFHFTIEDKKAPEMNIDRAKTFLEEKGYVILTKDKYKQMDETLSNQTSKREKEQTPLPDPSQSEKSITAYQLKIMRGMVSRDIANILAKEKVIDDASKFEFYLVENGYSKKIQLGSFKLTSQMSYKDIAKIITSS